MRNGLRFCALAVYVFPLLLTMPASAEPPYGKPPAHWSEEWYEERAHDPVGQRQVYKHGKLWPPFPRPVGRPQAFVHKYHANKFWPYPYNCLDRASVRGPLALQVQNGWIEASTLYDYHFDTETQTLNSSGVAHLNWVLLNAPPEQRVVFVQTGLSPDVSQVRIAQVQATASHFVGEAHVPPVMLRPESSVGRPALEVDLLRRAELQTTPNPRIPVSLSGGAGATGRAAGGGAGAAPNP